VSDFFPGVAVVHSDAVGRSEQAPEPSFALPEGHPFSPKSLREGVLHCFATESYEELLATCRRLQQERLPGEGPLLDVIAGFCLQEGLHYAAASALAARANPGVRPDFFGLFAKVAALQRYLRKIAGVPHVRTPFDPWEDPYMVTYIVYSDVPGEPKSRTEEEMTRAEVCERYPFLADLMADANSFFSYGDADYDIQVEPLDVNGRIK
jgi:hypothetical protein